MADITEKIYYLLVTRNPDIAMRYQRYRKECKGRKRIKAWFYLLKLNMQYSGSKQRDSAADDAFYSKKQLYLKGSESSLSKLEEPEMFVERLSAYDIITFDVFDTLIFRPFSKPSDLFFLAGDKLGYQDFERIRQEIEWKRREKQYGYLKNREITFDEIWEEMEAETGIPKETGQQIEWECEKKYCFANPYMLEVQKLLIQRGKRVAVVSDMYLGKELQKELLAECGYTEFDEYFVSCDYRKSKNDGLLYEVVKERYGTQLRYAHVGDNEYSDVRQAEKHGFTAFYYHNVNEQGIKYRAEDMSAIQGSIYRGLVNTYIHNGRSTYSMPYEFGFIYGGLFVLGYCGWIHNYVKNHGIDKILFLARDGEILSKAYDLLYPEEREQWEYVYWSRLAATKMASDYFKYDFFRRFLFHKVNQEYRVESIFQSMDLEEMLQGFLTSIENSEKLAADSILDEKAAECIKTYLMGHWEDVQRCYEEQKSRGKTYYSQILSGCKKAVAVDVGWAGSGAITLGHLVNQEWGLACEVIGLLAGTNTIFNQEPDSGEPLFYSGKLVSYMFSQMHNRDIWKFHNPGKGHNIVVELLLASGQKSFRSFAGEGNEYTFSESKEEINSEEVQKGILDFVSYYIKRMESVPNISGRDAFAPIKVVLENEAWWRKLIELEDVTMNLD